jgi:SAM-dependent methyltransferase
LIIGYRHVNEFIGWEKAFGFYSKLQREYACKQILEIGVGSDPIFSVEYINENQINYFINDISPYEIEKIKGGSSYEVLICDLSKKKGSAVLPRDSFDMVISRMVNEHIKDSHTYFENIFNILKPGGVTVHSFSCLYTMPFLVNFLMPDVVTEFFISAFTRRNSSRHSKFKAYYSWCRGPSKLMQKKFLSIGYEIIEFVGYFGHFYYKKKLPIMHKLEMLKTDLLCKHKVSHLCSYGHVVLRKKG